MTLAVRLPLLAAVALTGLGLTVPAQAQQASISFFVASVGKGNGAVTTGRHMKIEKETPMANLFLTMLDRVGAPTERLGDSTGKLAGLNV